MRSSPEPTVSLDITTEGIAKEDTAGVLDGGDGVDAASVLRGVVPRPKATRVRCVSLGRLSRLGSSLSV